MPFNKQKLLLVALLLVSLLWMQEGSLFVTTVSAAGWGAGEQTAANIMVRVIDFMNYFTWVCFVFLTYVLDPRFIFDMDAGGGLMEMLRTIWMLARDLMNVIFAFVLIIAAGWTIVTAKKDIITQHAPNFVMAVILVNFSWFFPRVVIDVANVSASAIFGVPSLIETQCQYTSSENEDNRCAESARPDTFICPCMVVTNLRFNICAELRGNECEELLGRYNTGRMNPDAETLWSCSPGGFVCIQRSPLDNDTITPYTILNGLIVNHLRLRQLITIPDINRNDITAGDMFTTLFRLGLVLVIHIAILFPLVAMLLAFLVRIPVLWITMAFMPFYFLSWVGGEKIDTQGYSKKLLDHFLKAAFLPAMVAVPFAVGYILLNAAGRLVVPEALLGLGIQLRLIDGLSNFWQLLWLVIGLLIIWTGVFTVLKGDDLMGDWASSIQHTGESIGRLAIKLPLSAPVLPGLGFTPLQALHTARSFSPQQFEHALGSTGSISDAFAQQIQHLRTRPIGENDIKRAVDRAPTNQTTVKNITNILNVNNPLSQNQIQQLHTELQTLLGRTFRREDILRLIQGMRSRGALPVLTDTHIKNLSSSLGGGGLLNP